MQLRREVITFPPMVARAGQVVSVGFFCDALTKVTQFVLPREAEAWRIRALSIGKERYELPDGGGHPEDRFVLECGSPTVQPGQSIHVELENVSGTERTSALEAAVAIAW